jgi:hypothetical protein
MTRKPNRKQQDLIDANMREFDREENPLYVWFTWQYCRREGFEVPEWACEYLDDCADKLMDLAYSEIDKGRGIPAEGKVAGKIGHALGMIKHGRANVFERYQNIERGLEVTARIVREHREGKTLTQCFEEQAEQENVAVSLVSDWYYKYRANFTG